MRIRNIFSAPLLAALIVTAPMPAPAQSITVQFGARLGPEIRVSSYAPDRLGDWHRNYRNWRPVTLYDVNGHYYRNPVNGARRVVVYNYNDDYFFPPQDHDWHGMDSRFDYKHAPSDDDYRRAEPFTERVHLDPRLGPEVGVFAYSRERAGDWRANMRRWTPVALYEVNGRFFEHNGAGARRIAAYRYHDEYFLPPTDEGWMHADKRFDYDHMPNHDDYVHVRIHP